MAYFGVYIPPSKAGFEGNLTQCAGSIAADNIKISPECPASGAEESSAYEDPEYPRKFCSCSLGVSPYLCE